MKAIKALIRQCAQQFGIDIVRHMPSLSFRRELFQKLGVVTVLDVGANEGQFAHEIRHEGWAGRIISFEPLVDAYEKLKVAAFGDPNWETCNLALGNSTGLIDMNVAANSQSSSILEFQESFSSISAELKKTKTIKVPVGKLDSVLAPMREVQDLGTLFLKLDVQGYEPHVIEGAVITLESVAAIQCELAFNVSYKGASDIIQMMDLLRKYGFVLHHLQDGWKDPRTQELYEVDGVFLRC